MARYCELNSINFLKRLIYLGINGAPSFRIHARLTPLGTKGLQTSPRTKKFSNFFSQNFELVLASKSEQNFSIFYAVDQIGTRKAYKKFLIQFLKNLSGLLGFKLESDVNDARLKISGKTRRFHEKTASLFRKNELV